MQNNNPNSNSKRKKKGSKSQKSQPTRSEKKQKKQNPNNPVGVASAYSSGQVGRAPKISASRDNCRITHRELVASIVGSADFTVDHEFSINPGLSASFPWLSSMAQSWQRYRFHKLRYCFFTRTGTTTPGSFMMAPDYNPADTAPVSEQIASSFEDVSEDAPWKNILCDLKTSRLHGTQKELTIRTGPLTEDLDIKTYDAGKLFAITIDGTAVPWGKLWVEYDVEFFIPQLPPSGVNQLMGGAIAGGGTMIANNPLGTVPVVDAEARGFSIDAASTITFENSGQFFVGVNLTGTTLSDVNVVASGAGSSTNVYYQLINTGSTQLAAFVRVTLTAPNQTITISSTAATITASNFYVGQVPINSFA